MIRPGQIALLRFPRTDLSAGKPRPVLVLTPLPGAFDDWLVCMISSQLRHAVPGFDEVIHEADPDFGSSGLKVASVFRISRLATVEGSTLLGAIGNVSPERLAALRFRLSRWLGGEA